MSVGPAVLVVHHEMALRETLHRVLQGLGVQPVTMGTGASVPDLVARERFDLVLLDLQLTDCDGLSVLQLLKERSPSVVVVLIAGECDVPTAVQAMRLGAEHVVTTDPLRIADLETVLARAVEAALLNRQNELHADRTADPFPLAGLGESPAMQAVVRAVDTLAATEAIVLLDGETGVGKEWTAELIHSLSSRTRGPFISVHCAGLTPAMLHAGSSGRERGTPARGAAPGRTPLEAAHGGTLFLGEVGDLSLDVQSKLLDVLGRRGARFDERQGTEVDVRVIAATTRDLRKLTVQGGFRDDLYWRIAAHRVRIPPLRDRGGPAIVEMSYRVLRELNRKLGRGPTRISAATLDRLVNHGWPGNILELSNVLEHAILNAGSAPEVLPQHLPPTLARRAPAPEPAHTGDWSLASVVDSAERRHILAALNATSGNRLKAAEIMGISRTTLYMKMKRHQLDV